MLVTIPRNRGRAQEPTRTLNLACKTSIGFEDHLEDPEAGIPDLWHVATYLRGQGQERAANAVLHTWHLAHDLWDETRRLHEEKS